MFAAATNGSLVIFKRWVNRTEIAMSEGTCILALNTVLLLANQCSIGVCKTSTIEQD